MCNQSYQQIITNNHTDNHTNNHTAAEQVSNYWKSSLIFEEMSDCFEEVSLNTTFGTHQTFQSVQPG